MERGHDDVAAGASRASGASRAATDDSACASLGAARPQRGRGRGGGQEGGEEAVLEAAKALGDLPQRSFKVI